VKFQKMDSKQTSQAIVLGVLCIGVVGYGGYSLMAGDGTTGTPAAAAVKEGTPDAEAPAPEPGPEAGAVVAQKAPSLPGQYNPDPFRPAVKPTGTGTPAVRAVTPAPVKVAPAPAPAPARGPAPTLPPVVEARASVQAAEVKEEKPAPPPPPVRPEVAVNGIIDAEGGKDMALAEVGEKSRILRVGDVLPNNYRVKRIGMDGVLLVHARDRYFVELGAKEEPAAAGQGKG